jgi:hypothetical protein
LRPNFEILLLLNGSFREYRFRSGFTYIRNESIRGIVYWYESIDRHSFMLGMSLICHINYKSLCLIRKNYFHIYSDTAENDKICGLKRVRTRIFISLCT